MNEFVGTGAYTPRQASRLIGVPAPKLSRWLRGHSIGEHHYAPLWEPEITIDGDIYLGFLDLMEARVASEFIRIGLSAIQVRRAIEIARDEIGNTHPLSTNRFRTDGREIFLEVVEKDDVGQTRERLLNIFRKQYEFKNVIDPILRTVDFGSHGQPSIWWPRGRNVKILIDPKRSFGHPIEGSSSVPTAVLANAAAVDGVRQAAINFDVTEAAVTRSVEFEKSLH